tara:strand:+ start:1324 stop:2187 length:864 start_codon:yes stop_codon:yes gene_type:complete
MPRYAYVNGRFLPHNRAAIHIEDRGFQFGDSVYEVVTIVKKRLVDLAGHLDRLNRSLGELHITWPVSRNVLEILMRQLLVRNRVSNGIIYIQISRGVAPRDHKFPLLGTPTSLVMTTRSIVHEQSANFRQGVKVITIPDIRWQRCDIKSTSLLPNCLGKQRAFEAGAYEAWQVGEDDNITEGTSSNAWILNSQNELITRAPAISILNGITRLTIIEIAEKQGVTFIERPFSVTEAKRAVEAFTTSATSFVTPVTQIDDTILSENPGPLTLTLLDRYRQYIDCLEPAL